MCVWRWSGILIRKAGECVRPGAGCLVRTGQGQGQEGLWTSSQCSHVQVWSMSGPLWLCIAQALAIKKKQARAQALCRGWQGSAKCDHELSLESRRATDWTWTHWPAGGQDRHATGIVTDPEGVCRSVRVWSGLVWSGGLADLIINDQTRLDSLAGHHMEEQRTTGNLTRAFI